MAKKKPRKSTVITNRVTVGGKTVTLDPGGAGPVEKVNQRQKRRSTGDKRVDFGWTAGYLAAQRLAAARQAGIITTPRVNQVPVAAFAVAPTGGNAVSANAGGSFDNDGLITRYDWDWGDGNTTARGGVSPTHTYAAAGTYTVQVTVYDNDPVPATAQTTQQVTVPPPAGAPPVAAISANALGLLVTATCAGSAAVAPGTSIATYDIDWGDGTAHGTVPDDTHIYAAAGSYTITLTLTDSAGSVTTATTQTTPAPVTIPGSVVDYAPGVIYNVNQMVVAENEIWSVPVQFTSTTADADITNGRLVPLTNDFHEIRMVNRWSDLPAPASRRAHVRPTELFLVRQDDAGNPLNRLVVAGTNPPIPSVWRADLDAITKTATRFGITGNAAQGYDTSHLISNWMMGIENEGVPGSSRPPVGDTIVVDGFMTTPGFVELRWTPTPPGAPAGTLGDFHLGNRNMDGVRALIGWEITWTGVPAISFPMHRNGDGGQIFAVDGFVFFSAGRNQRFGFESSPGRPGTSTWIPLQNIAHAKALRTGTDAGPPHLEGDLQVTKEQDHTELKWWDATSSTWLEIFSEDKVKQWIASNSLFRGTVEQVGGPDAADIKLNELPAPTPAQREYQWNGHYWVWNGAEDYEVTGTTPVIGTDLAGVRLTPGDWLQMVDRNAPHAPAPATQTDTDYHWTRIPGHMLTKDRADKAYGLHEWMDGQWEKDSLVMAGGKVYRAATVVRTGDPAPGAPGMATAIEGQGASRALADVAAMATALADPVAGANAGRWWVNTSAGNLVSGGITLEPGDALLNTGYAGIGVVKVDRDTFEGGVPSFAPAGASPWVDLKIGGTGAAAWQANHAYNAGDEFYWHVPPAAADTTTYSGVDFLFRVTTAHTSPANFDPSADTPPWVVTGSPVYVGETANASQFVHGALWYQPSTASLSLLDKNIAGGWVKVVR